MAIPTETPFTSANPQKTGVSLPHLWYNKPISHLGDFDVNPAPIRDWRDASEAPENVSIWTKIDDKDGERNVQTLKRQGSLWWYPDMTMYVYYRPTHWAPVGAA